MTRTAIESLGVSPPRLDDKSLSSVGIPAAQEPSPSLVDEPATPSDVAELRDRLAEAETDAAQWMKTALKAERDMIRWRAAIQDLTPLGSEFMDPEAVKAFARRQKTECCVAKLEAARLRKQLRDVAGSHTPLISDGEAALLRPNTNPQVNPPPRPEIERELYEALKALAIALDAPGVAELLIRKFPATWSNILDTRGPVNDALKAYEATQ